ncbi:hypothetical protein [Demequina globuliformis]|uniref:hypothetical protein n=1 Tax=Demequina globuliformis TaxID=676202 RepID=UPI000782B131|nr:hypothetical protein [Demequina globuliformis]
MSDVRVGDSALAQGIAAQVSYLASTRAAELASNLERILAQETDELAEVASRMARAGLHIDVARLNIDGIVDANRGGVTGVHGFIAEYAQEGVANAARAIDGLKPLTKVLADNGPADLLVNGVPVQMKFYASPQSQLLKASDYRDMEMMFAKDRFELFDRIMRGDKYVELDGTQLSSRKVEAIRELIQKESTERGQEYTAWMRPSELDYSEVQKNAIGGTLDDKADSLRKQADQQRQQVRDDSDVERVIAAQQAAPSWGEAAKVGATGAAVQGGLAFGMFVFQRHRQGKEIWQFDSQDWRDGGLETAKGGLKGGITGLSIYGLTQVCHMNAPAAAAVASGTIGLALAVADRRAGKLDDDEFADVVLFNAMESTGAAIGAALGQAVIPVPIVGAVVGSIAASVILGQGKKFLSESENKLIDARLAEINAYVASLDAKLEAEFLRITEAYDYYRDLQDLAFDVEANIELQLLGSVYLARAVGVPEDQLLRSVEDADVYFLGNDPAGAGAPVPGAVSWE